MTVPELIGLVANGSLILVALLTLADLLRKRDRVSLDIHLMFAALASIIVLQRFAERIHVAHAWIRLAGPMLLLAHPFLLLRLIRHSHEVPVAGIRAVLGGLLACWIVAVAAPVPAPASALLFVCLYFVAAEIYAATAFRQGARSAGGVSRPRLNLAALGSALMATLVFLLGLISFLPQLRAWLTPMSQLAALLAALSYYFGFVPPRRLGRFWQLAELYRFLQQTANRPVEERARLALDDLCAAAIHVAGGRAALAALWDEPGRGLRIRASSEPGWGGTACPLEEGLIASVWRSLQPRAARDRRALGAREQAWAEGVGATAALAVPIAVAGAGRGRGVLAVLLRRSPLFAADDLQLLALLGGQCALALENADLLASHEALVESAPDAIITVNPAGEILLVNAASERLFGYQRHELLGQSIEMLLPERLRSRHVAERTRYVAHAVSRPMGSGRELFARRKDGVEFPAEISLSPIGGAAGMIVMSIIRDISERKQAEREMARRNLQLEALNRELEAFSYSVSHDLRTPLRAIDGYSHIVISEFSRELPERGQQYLDQIRKSTKRMDGLIRGLLDTSRMGRQAVHRRPVSLGDLVREVLLELQPGECGPRTEIVIGELPACEADPALVKQVLANLLKNAFKFTRHREAPRVELGAGPPEDGFVCCFVKDNGVGFDMRYADKLFGVFQRLHRMEDFEGSGIGLAIVKSIVQRHGGRVWAEGEVDRGATFYFTLPATSPAALSETRASAGI